MLAQTLRMIALLILSALLLGTGLCSAWGLTNAVRTLGAASGKEYALLFLGFSVLGLAICYLAWRGMRVLLRSLFGPPQAPK